MNCLSCTYEHKHADAQFCAMCGTPVGYDPVKGRLGEALAALEKVQVPLDDVESMLFEVAVDAKEAYDPYADSAHQMLNARTRALKELVSTRKVQNESVLSTKGQTGDPTTLMRQLLEEQSKPAALLDVTPEEEPVDA